MRSCAIIISHYESLPFLHTCIRQVRKHAHPEIKQHIFIVDQSSDATYQKIYEGYYCSADITIVRTRPHYSGYGIDFLMRYCNVHQEYVAQLHVDAFPISDKWLRLAIGLIEEFDLAFTGQLQFISKPTDTIYPPNVPFFAMAQCFNVATLETYREMSINGGFTRFHERNKIQPPLDFANRDWRTWAKKDYQHRGSDDDVVAFYWEDKYRQHNKLGLAITGYIEPSYGRIIEDVVFHFGSCREAMGVMNHMPAFYQSYTKKIHEDYSDQLVNEMVDLAKRETPPELEILSRNYWSGIIKMSAPAPEQIVRRINELKQ